MSNLLPCPFCGEKPAVESGGHAPIIFCAGNDCMGPHTTAANEADAAAQWNKRSLNFDRGRITGDAQGPFESREDLAKAIAYELEDGAFHGARVTGPHLDNYHIYGHVNLLALAGAILRRAQPPAAPVDPVVATIKRAPELLDAAEGRLAARSSAGGTMEGQRDAIVQAIHAHVDIREFVGDAPELTGVEDAADAAIAAFYAQPPAAPVEAERRCQKCGETTKGEEALVDGQIWCHPCADHPRSSAATEVLDFLNSIEGAGYGGMASFEIARAHVQDMLGTTKSAQVPMSESKYGLLPCPFCGAPARTDLLPHVAGPVWVQCSECECDQIMSDTLDEAVERWNRRAVITSTEPQGVWQCAARKQGTSGGNAPADCDWPSCGCDPAANKVLEALDEAGFEITKRGPAKSLQCLRCGTINAFGSISRESQIAKLSQAIEAEARRYAEMYPQSSDGRNTFVIFADWVASLALSRPEQS